MDKHSLIKVVIQTVSQVQELSGRPSARVGKSTCPIGGMEGFDSLCGVEATVILSESLGVDLPQDYNPFVSEDGKQALSIAEIADSLSTYIKAEAVAR